jgi:N-acetylmuramoyl-L-alanine amidase
MRRFIIIGLILFLGAAAFKSDSLQASSGTFDLLKPPFFSSVDVLIDVGHGGVDSGTLYGELYEKDVNLEIARLTYALMREKGINVMIDRIDDYALSGENLWLNSRSRHRKDLAQRSHLANEIHPKTVISLHVNWSKNSAKRGPLILHQKNEASKQLAQQLQHSLNSMYGTSNKAVVGKPYYLLKHVNSPAVIVEMGFISNDRDREQMTRPEKQMLLAQAIIAGVEAYLRQGQAAPAS